MAQDEVILPIAPDTVLILPELSPLCLCKPLPMPSWCKTHELPSSVVVRTMTKAVQWQTGALLVAGHGFLRKEPNPNTGTTSDAYICPDVEPEPTTDRKYVISIAVHDEAGRSRCGKQSEAMHQAAKEGWCGGAGCA